MFKVLMIGLLLLYYYYFYVSFSASIPKPDKGFPKRAEPYKLKLHSFGKNKFRLTLNRGVVWEHSLPDETYMLLDEKIIPRDSCYGIQDFSYTVAKGRVLYDYLKANPEFNDLISFKEDSSYTFRSGNPFYFTCKNNRIEKLNLCPSGSTFQHGTCGTINVCTDKPDGSLFPHPNSLNIGQYIDCQQGEGVIKSCSSEKFFYFDRCVNMTDLNHYCTFYPNEPYMVDAMTRVGCKDGKPFYTRCSEGTRFFDNDYCEPTNCEGLMDGTKLPLPDRTVDPFHFVPGYMTCQDGKVAQTTECPKVWDDRLSKGDNLTSLPMVFDGDTCSVPSFCENVFSNDPNVVVPVYEFTRYVKNWNFSRRYDNTVGYVCKNNTRKRVFINSEFRIGKRFKLEPACDQPIHLPINSQPQNYYDCVTNTILSCPPSEYFNGSTCTTTPSDAFEYNQLPLFKFNNLNSESWMEPWEYSSEPSEQNNCVGEESTFLKLYNLCSHPDCSSYAFLSMIPDLALLLPREKQAKCKIYGKKLKKEPVDFEYSFWNQKWVQEASQDDCTPGQTLKTGNFIWDSTVYATCDPDHPFIFCPSAKTTRIIQTPSQQYTCETPDGNEIKVKDANWMPFSSNEVKRVKPENWDIANPQYIRKNKGSKPEILPEDGLNIGIGERFNMFAEHPTVLELRYRVSHPPNVAYEYNDNNDVVFTVAPDNYGFMVKLQNFTTRHLAFPKYEPINYVDSFIGHHLFYND